MADIRIKDLATTATTTASDDFMAVDGATNGTRKLNAAAPAFLTSVTTPSLTSPALSPLTLGTGTSGAAITVLSASNNVGIGTTSPLAKLDLGSDVTAQKLLLYGSGFIRFGMGMAGSEMRIFVPQSGNRISFGGIASGDGSTFTEAMRIDTTSGTVSIASTTAGSSNAGALVVTGGLSAGNNGNASYFGGAVSGAAATFRPASDGVGLTLNQANSASAGWSFSALNTGSLAVTRVGGVAAMTCDLNGSTTFYTSGTQTFGAVVISSGNTLKLGNAYVGGAAVGTGTITIQDSTGTTYRIPVLV